MYKKLIKFLMIIGIIFQIAGCTSLKNYLGKKDIKNATKIYNKDGVTLKGVEKLANGIEIVPHSLEGTTLFNIQYSELENKKNKILKKSSFSKDDLDTLKLYIYAGKKAKNLSVKNSRIIYNDKKYLEDKKIITQRIEKYILNEDVSNYNRKNKINKIYEYNEILKYISSKKILERKEKLEEDVTLRVAFSSSNLGYDTLSNIIRGELYRVSNRYRGMEIEDYIYFEGYGKTQDADYLIELNFMREDVMLRKITTEEKDGNKIFTKEKELVVSGHYNIFEVVDRKVLNIKDFEIRRYYTVSTSQSSNQIIFDSEREKIEELIRDEFERNLFQDIRFFVNELEI